MADIRDIMGNLTMYRDSLNRAARQQLERNRKEAERLFLRLKVFHPDSRIRDMRNYSIRLEEQMQSRMDQIIERKRHRLDLYISRIKGLSPLDKLQSGFSYVEDENGHNIHTVEGITVGQELRIRVQDGDIYSRVTEIKEAPR